MLDTFSYSKYVFYRYAGAVAISDENEKPLMYAEKKGTSKIGKPFHVYTSKHRTKELLRILPQKGFSELIYFSSSLLTSVIPINLEFTVTDVTTGEEVGKIVQKSINRITKDEWKLIQGGKVVGNFKSVRYFLHSIFFPRTYKITVDNKVVGSFKQHRNVLNFKYTMDIADRCIDTRLLIAVGIIITYSHITF